MSWQPISESEIWDLINDSLERMNLEQKRLWDLIQIVPEKWSQQPWGKGGGGFWVVGIIGRNVIWYNDIEDGFNRSTFKTFGEIDEYWCNQDQLELTVQFLINEMRDGYDSSGKCGPPQPLDSAI
jgi:hypothetical protein